jgi:hypothetical protein
MCYRLGSYSILLVLFIIDIVDLIEEDIIMFENLLHALILFELSIVHLIPVIPDSNQLIVFFRESA